MPDETDRGVRIDLDHTVISGEGGRSHPLPALGPLLRETFWETVALPELHAPPKRAAETLLNPPSAPDAKTSGMMECMT